jgi:predicted XRE-type DNA-binding protein
MPDDARVTRAGDNVFETLGLPEPEADLMKARLVTIIAQTIERQGLTQTAAAARLGLAQPDLSRLLRGRFGGFSLERLLHLVVRLGSDVDIRVRPAASQPPSEGQLRLSVV